MNETPGEEVAPVIQLRKKAPGTDLAVPADIPSRAAEPALGAALPPGARRDVVPHQLRRENIKGTAAQFAGLSWHRARYHGLRLPLHVLSLLLFALAGLYRVASVQLAWWWETDLSDLKSAAVMAGDSRETMRIQKELRQVRKFRGGLLLAELAVLAIAVTWAVRDAPRPYLYAAAAVLTVALAFTGKPEGRTLIAPATVPPEYEIPTPEIITRGLASLGIPKIDQVLRDGRKLDFISDVMQSGPGWGVHVDLPFGVTASQILAKREELASGLRRPLSAVWPSPGPSEHTGRLELWIGFHDMAKMKPPKWPLARTGAADLFAGLPLGTDPRQRPVTVPLFEVNWLIGGSPGAGKTAAVRALCLGTSLDVLTDIWVHELASKGDLEALAQVSVRYVSGLDDESVAYAADSAQMLRAQLTKRAVAFGRLPKEAKPHGSITRDLAMRGFRPIVAVFEECQNLFLHPEFGEQAAADLAYVIRLGRALGIIVILSTQRPAKESLPTEIRGIVTARLCFKVPDHDANDMILGTGAYRAGYNAAIFRAKTDAGLGWLRGDGEPQVIKTYYIDLPAAAKIAARARQMREKAGVLSGYALGEHDEFAAPRDVIADVLRVFGSDRGLQWGELADRLADQIPERWADATAEAVSAQCRARGVKSVDVRSGGQVLKGLRKISAEQAARY